ncbi:peptide ABC transporter substrate-binding protein [Ruminococcaceae bacterium OttesenSCG-928-N02]|nr:peptide ABC transporter substrate-binding protein [Ruminococcaceae bacterium OttesenSCG-928-N02]
MKRALALVLALGMALSMFAACGSGNGGANGGVIANELVYNLSSEPQDLCSITTAEGYSMTAIYMMVDGLLRRDENANPIPGIAQEWTFDEDTLTYTFNLRNDALWNNGEPVTAHDFVFAWRMLADSTTGADYGYQSYIIKNGRAVFEGDLPKEELGVRAVDDYTLEVQLEQPCGYALFMFTFCCFFPVNENIYTEYGDLYATEAQYIGTNGMYNITEWAHEDHMTFERNENYYDAQSVAVDKITFVMISDTNAATNAFKVGEIDILPQVAAEQAAALTAEGYRVAQYNNNSARFITFNMGSEIFSNENIRRAFAYGFSREDLTGAVLADGSMPAYSFCPEIFEGYEDTFIVEAGAPFFDDANIATATDYLELGMQELGITREDFAGISIIVDENSIYQKVVAYLLEQWKINLGVEITAEVMPKKSRIERMYDEHSFDIGYTTWGPDYNDPNTFLDMLMTDGDNNGWDYSNAQYDELLALAAAETDVETRMAYLAECEQIVSGQCLAAPMYFECANYVVSDQVVNYVPVGWGMPLRYTSVAIGE